MKLVIATPLYPPEIGGPATYVRELEKGLQSYGIDPIIVKFSDVRGKPKFWRHYVYYRRVLTALKGADAVLALDPVSVGLPAMKAARKAGKPFVVKIVGDYAWEQGVQRFGITQNLDEFVKTKQTSFFVRKLQSIQTRVAQNAARIIVPSQYLGKIVAAWGIPGGKITVIYNGVELGEIKMPEKRSTKFLIVSSGRNVSWKGFESLRTVVRREPDWNVVIGSDLPRPEVLGWAKSADVFVLNSSYEGLSHALIEVMMLGVPVIATAVGGNTELIEDGVTGLLVPVGNDDALFSALKKIETDKSGAQARAKAAQARAKAFSKEKTLSATAELLKNL